MPQYSTLARLAPIAEDQWGLVTRRQMEQVGIPPTTRDRLTSDRSILERVASGVYRLTGVPTPDHMDLRAAWLQLASEIPAWDRSANQGVVSHRSAASLYRLGHLPPDRHQFTVPQRRQSRRPDVRLHTRRLQPHEYIELTGMPVTRPSRIASDLLYDREDPDAVAQLIADAIRGGYDYPGTFANALAPHATRFGLRRSDGLALLGWFLDLARDPHTDEWMKQARDHVARTSTDDHERRAAPSRVRRA